MQIARYEAHLHAIMTTVISPNIRKESVRIDPDGNVINARTKQIIEPVTPEYVAPAVAPVVVSIAPTMAPVAPLTPMGELSVLDQIAQAKKHLAELEELKKFRIAEKKAELELLEQ